MREIIKYQLKGRVQAILSLLLVFGAVNAVAWVAEIYGFATGARTLTPFFGFLVFVATAGTWVATIVMFFMCSSGHVNELLFKDTSYLMLTVPRRGWEIIGGRLVAGLAEFALYAIPTLIAMSVHAAIGTVYGTAGKTGFFAAMAFIYRDIFATNFLSALKLLGLGILMFVSTGAFIMFAGVAARSFVRTKKLAIAIGVVLFMLISDWSMKLGTWISERLDWYVRVPLSVDISSFGGMMRMNGTTINTFSQEGAIPLVPFLIFLAVALALYAAASWLMERKVEL